MLYQWMIGSNLFELKYPQIGSQPVNRYRTRSWDFFNPFLSPTNLATPDLSIYFPRLTNGWLIEHVGFPPQNHQCNIAQSQFKANHSKLQSLSHVSWNLYKAEDRLVLTVVFFSFSARDSVPLSNMPMVDTFPQKTLRLLLPPPWCIIQNRT